MAFEVVLGEVSVGRLEMTANGRGTRLVLHDDYRTAARRPLLSQQFKSFRPTYNQPAGVLPFFAHLLPEGALRSVIATAARIDSKADWRLLGLLGRDLPGAVRLFPIDQDYTTTSAPERELDDEPPPRTTVPPSRWRFSISGVQLKFSMEWRGDRLTFPAENTDGKWIIKLGDASHPDLPEVEYVTMRWAHASGIDIPPLHLVNLDRLEGIPRDYTADAGRHCFAIKRFDRDEGRQRIHIEDFAQVLAADDKYQGHSYESIGNVILRICGRDDLREYVRRLVFMVLCGNGDAHLKNWSLIYPDGVHARLSPAYDLVATVVYPYDRELALNFNRSRRFEDVSLAGFGRFARKLDFDETELCRWVQEDVARVMHAWRELRVGSEIGASRREQIEQHLEQLRRTSASIIHS